MTPRRLTLQLPPFAGRTGRGVRVAMIDSGAAPGHPHVGTLAGGVWLTADGESADWGDRIGHGTAVAAAIREKAPDAELVAVRVFGTRLATSATILARAIVRAASDGARVINLSLGTDNAAHAELLAGAVALAAERGALVVAAAGDDGRRWLPGTLPGVVGVVADAASPRDAIAVVPGSLGSVLACSPLPRPIDGVPPGRNLSGISFAVANATGFLARLLEAEEGGALRTADAVCAHLAATPHPAGADGRPPAPTATDP